MSEHPMPDFTDALEEQLRVRAQVPCGAGDVASPARRRMRRRHTPVAVAALSCAALLVAVFAIVASDEDHTPAAYGRPLILREHPTDAPEVIKRLQNGMSARLVLGTDARLTTARAIEAFGSTAYVVTGPSGWCLAAPDPKLSGDALRTGGVTCARTRQVHRYGIALAVGGNVIAALPDNAKPPTLTTPDGSLQTLRPSDLGVVTAAVVKSGSVFTLYGEDGSQQTLHIHTNG
jgi:hypothetical protein